MTEQEISARRLMAFELFKILFAKGTTDWDFAPLAAKACDAAEACQEILLQRYPINVTSSAVPEPPQPPQPPPPAPWGVQGPEGVS
jgi:hypothetical protein